MNNREAFEKLLTDECGCDENTFKMYNGRYQSLYTRDAYSLYVATRAQALGELISILLNTPECGCEDVKDYVNNNLEVLIENQSRLLKESNHDKQ